MHHEALLGVKPDSLLNVDVPPRHWEEEALCPEESFCSGEVVPCPDGVRFLGELLFVDEDCSHHVTRPLSQTHSAGEVRRSVAPSYAARFHCEEAPSPSQTHSADEAPPVVVS